MPPTEDQILLDHFAQTASQEAFTALVRRHIDWVSSMARRLSGDPAMAEDVTQAVFLLLARNARKLRKNSRISSWLFVVTRYCVKNARRNELLRKKREREAAAMRSEILDSTDATWEELSPMLDELVGRLGTVDREAVLLRFYRGMSFPEIGQVLRMSEEAARKRVMRAVGRLRAGFERRGVGVSAAALPGLMEMNLTQPATAGTVAAATAVQGGAAGAAVTSIAKPVGMWVGWMSLKPVAMAVIGLMLTSATVVVVTQVGGSGRARQAQAQTPTTMPAIAQNDDRPRRLGRILTPEGRPIGGARVYLTEPESFGDPRPIDTTTTDGDGRFGIAGARPMGRALVMVFAPGLGLTPVNVAIEGDDQPLESMMKPPTDATIRFIAPDGQSAAGVRVRVARIQQRTPPLYADLPPQLYEQFTQTTDAAGKVTFSGLPQDCSISLDVLDDRYARLNFEQRITTQSAPASDGGAIRLALGAAVTGRITYADTGAPAAGIKVGAQGLDRSEWGGTITDEQGRYTLKQMSAAKYNIALDLQPDLEKRYTAAAHEALQLVAGAAVTDADFKLIKGGLIQGTVKNRSTGRGIAGVSVGVYGPAHPQSSAWVQNAQTAADGSYTLRVPPGAQHVYLQGIDPPGMGRAGPSSYDVQVGDGQTTTVDFEYASRGSPPVTGRVVDVNGKPVVGAEVSVGDENATVLTDVQGRFTIPAVRDGSELRVAKGALGLEQPQIIVHGNRDLTVVIRKLEETTALVRVTSAGGAPVAGAKVQLIQFRGSMGMGSQAGVTNPDGTYILKSLSPSGNYRIQITADGYGQGQSVLPIQPGKQTETSIALPLADSRVGGIVISATGQPLPDVQVICRGRQSMYQETKTDVTGRFSFKSIVPGDVIELQIRTGNSDYQSIEIPAGTTDAVLIDKHAQAPVGL